MQFRDFIMRKENKLLIRETLNNISNNFVRIVVFSCGSVRLVLMLMVVFYSGKLLAQCFYFVCEIGRRLKEGSIDALQVILTLFFSKELTEV